jgi:hypothetical protein
MVGVMDQQMTAERDVAELRDRGLTGFVPKPAPGRNRLIAAPYQAELPARSTG